MKPLAYRLLMLCAMLLDASAVFAQTTLPAEDPERAARRGAGVRVGVWQVDDPVENNVRFRTSVLVEGYFQRGLGSHVALESTVAGWRRIATETFPATGTEVVTQSYVIPLMTALKFYPFTDAASRLEPFVLGGVGFALGIINEGENAIGGGGTSIQTGFGFKTAAGLELHVTHALGIMGAARYQYLKYSEELGFGEVFGGVGYEAGVTYRFTF